MANNNNLVGAREFFDNESFEFKKEMEVETLLVDIACEFIKYRDKHGLTQRELADKLQITQAMVSKLESGDYNPSVKMLFEIAQKLEWNFKIEFNEMDKRINYQYEMKEAAINNPFNLNMGLAS